MEPSSPQRATAGVRLLLVRHGAQESSARRPPDQKHDPPLSEAGHQQAEATAAAIAERLTSIGRYCSRATVFSSPMRRALHTAWPIARALGVQLVCCGDLHEFRAGAEPQRTAVAIAADGSLQPPGVVVKRFGPSGAWVGQGVVETEALLRERAAAVAQWLEAELSAELSAEAERRSGGVKSGALIIVVSHQTFLDCLAQTLLDQTADGFVYGAPKYEIAKAGVLSIACLPGGYSLEK